MKRTAATLLSLLLTTACGKSNTPTTTPDDGTAAGGGGSTTGEPAAETAPPQDPDPAELAPAVHQVLTGHYEEAIGVLDPLYQGMTEPTQYRGSGLAAGWVAVAHSQIVFENAEAPANYALEMSGKLADPEVEAVAKLGRGAYLLAQEDYAAAKEAFAASAGAAPESAAGAYAQVLLAQAQIGTAFGSADSTELEHPEDLDAAKASYEAAIAAAGGLADEKEIILGRAKEGLAAVAKYQRQKDALCTAAFESISHYEAAGASSFLLDGPTRLATDSKCKQ